jgi:hypothetical protein
VADENTLEWVTPGHPLFEALRRNALDEAQPVFADGACFYSLRHERPARVDFYRARVVDGMGKVIHERLFAIEIPEGGEPSVREPTIVGDLQPGFTPQPLPAIASAPEAVSVLQEKALTPFLEEVRAERVEEIERIREHVEISLTELIARADLDIGRCEDQKDRGVEGAAGLLKIAIDKHDELCRRRERRREELDRQKALHLEAVERFTSALVLPHPERESPALQRLRPNPETEATAMLAAMEYERAAGRAVADVHEKDLGYDLTSLDTRTGELRLIEVKGLAGSEGEVILTPNEHRVAEDRRDCYWLYVVTECISGAPTLTTIPDPAKHGWRIITKVDHYSLNANEIRGSS